MLCTGFFMILVDTTVVNVAIPSIIDALNASLDQILWVVNAYMMIYAVLLITAGRLGDLYGQRNVMVVGMVIFVLASVFSGLSQDTNQLIAARVLQGVGGALLTPQTLAIMTNIFPPERRGTAFGVWGAVAGIATIVGPTLGGLIVTNWSWRWIFYINLPIGIVSLIATFLIVPSFRPGRVHHLDLPGIALASAGLFGIVFGLIEGQPYNWGAVWGWVTIPEVIAAGVLLLIGFVVWERKQVEPLIPLSLFADRNFSLMNVVVAAVAFSMLGLFLPIIIYLQSVLGMTALEAGMALLPLSILSMFAAPISGRLADRMGGKYILIIGLVLNAIGMGAIVLLATPHSTWSTFLVPLIVGGLGQGFVMAPMTAVAMRGISPRVAGAASGVFNTTRQMGAVIGSAAVGAVLEHQLASELRAQAIADSAKLPPEMRQGFVDALANAVSGGLEIGPRQSGGFQLPPGIPAQAAEQFRQLFHDVFINGFVAAMRPSLVVPILVILLAAAICLGIERKVANGRHPQKGEAPTG
ncbi:MAG: DHA2 family efflux MFS transporter permease subunit [Chloroflexi bacterium]|nr:DHA2 family efflux MFS transporter permease subunit [Chloroflexota bacterium]